MSDQNESVLKKIIVSAFTKHQFGFVVLSGLIFWVFLSTLLNIGFQLWKVALIDEHEIKIWHFILESVTIYFDSTVFKFSLLFTLWPLLDIALKITGYFCTQFFATIWNSFAPAGEAHLYLQKDPLGFEPIEWMFTFSIKERHLRVDSGFFQLLVFPIYFCILYWVLKDITGWWENILLIVSGALFWFLLYHLRRSLHYFTKEYEEEIQRKRINKSISYSPYYFIGAIIPFLVISLLSQDFKNHFGSKFSSQSFVSICTTDKVCLLGNYLFKDDLDCGRLIGVDVVKA